MYYHMYGATINTLTIRTQKGNSAAINRWKMSGNQGNVWHYLSGVNLPLDSQTKVSSDRQEFVFFTTTKPLQCRKITTNDTSLLNTTSVNKTRHQTCI